MSEDFDRRVGPPGKPETGSRPIVPRRATADEVIAELRQAALERHKAELDLSEPASDDLADALAEASRRIVVLEARVLAQDRTLRHVMATLVEWIEGDGARRALA